MKYKFTDETIKFGEFILHRIECVEAFGNVEAGEKGGWIEKESNLSQEGNAWVYGGAKVYGNAQVYGKAQVSGNAEVYGKAQVSDNAQVFGDAQVSDNAVVCGNARVFGNARVCDSAVVSGHVQVYGDTYVFDNARLLGNAQVYGNAVLYDNAVLHGNAEVYGDAAIKGDAEISQVSDYIVFKNNFSSGRYFTWTRSNNMWAVGCFYGTGEELIEKARLDSKVKARYYALYVKLVEDFQKVKL